MGYFDYTSHNVLCHLRERRGRIYGSSSPMRWHNQFDRFFLKIETSMDLVKTPTQPVQNDHTLRQLQ